MGTKLNLVGQKFNRLVVLSEYSIRTKWGAVKYLCKCSCGKEVIVSGTNLKSGNTKSCGCYAIEKITKRGHNNAKHMRSGSLTNKIYYQMISRCYKQQNEKYESYGKRGITVCDRWLKSFQNFYSDMGDKPIGDYSIERIDNNGNYCPENCKWATRTEQQNNKRTNHIIEYKGLKYTMANLCKVTGMKYELLHSRIHYAKWDIEKTLNTPLKWKDESSIYWDR